MKSSTTETLIITAALLKLADSLTPTTRMVRDDDDGASAKMSMRAAKRAGRSSGIERLGVGLNGSLVPKKPTRLLT